MSSKLEEIKTEMFTLVDEAWHALEGTADVDKARALAGQVTAALTSKAQDIAEHLFYHVLNNSTSEQTVPATETAPVQGGETIPVPADGSPSATGTAEQPAEAAAGDSRGADTALEG